MTREDKILEIYEQLKEHCLGVYLVGSRVLNYIDNPSDYDYIFLYDSEESRTSAKIKFNKLYNRLELHNEFNVDIHFKVYDNTFQVCDAWHMNDSIITVIGDDSLAKNAVKLLDSAETIQKGKDTCIYVYNRYIDCINKHKNLNIYDRRYWFYLYRIMCIIKNNSYELTEEQITNINIIHDRKDEQKLKQLIDEMIKEIQSWQN